MSDVDREREIRRCEKAIADYQWLLKYGNLDFKVYYNEKQRHYVKRLAYLKNPALFDYEELFYEEK